MNNTIKLIVFCLLLFLFGGVAILLNKIFYCTNHYVELSCFTSYGETKNIVLYEGTQVVLKPGSVLLYPKTFSNYCRSVYLKGEAVFNISSDKRRFLINSGKRTIMAEGNSSLVFISFNNDSLMRVTPFSGKVKLISSSELEKECILPLNIRSEINNNTGRIRFFRTSEYKNGLYKNGSIVFQNETLDFILKSLMRNYNRDFNYDSDIYRGNRYTITFFPYSDIDETINILNTITGVNVF